MLSAPADTVRVMDEPTLFSVEGADAALGPVAAVADVPAVRVIRSSRRTKTSSARLVGGIVEVRIPAWLSAGQEAEIVADLVARVHRARDLTVGSDLAERAQALAKRFGLPTPADIRWSTRQQKRWGSCTPERGTVRISSRLRQVPAYVLDAVIVHELAHLVEPNHGPAFKELESRFPKRDRADGFLEAMGLGCADGLYVSDEGPLSK